MKLAIVLDDKVNMWAFQRFEPLLDAIDITVFIGQRNDYDVSSIDSRVVAGQLREALRGVL